MKIKFELENCYGIRKLNHEFEFIDNKPITIHSSNGTMKSSLCKTMADIQHNRITTDQVHVSRITTRNVEIDGRAANNNDFLVYNSFENSSIYESLSKIILRNDMKKRYDLLTEDQNNIEREIVKRISRNIGLRDDKTRDLYLSIFNTSTLSEAIYKAIRISKSSLKLISLKGKKYKDLFDSPVKRVLSDSKTVKSLKDYNSQYNKMLKKSKLFTSGVFEISNLNTVSLVLENEKYFEGNNYLLLNSYPEPVTSLNQLRKIIDLEISNINKDPKIKSSFKSVVDKCGNQKNLASFFNVIKYDKVLSKQYQNIERFQRMFLSYNLMQFPDEVTAFKTKSKSNRKSLRLLVNQARSTKSDWEDLIKVYKERFYVPYDIEIVNQTNSILGIEEPIIEFKYENQPVEESKMINSVLSSSEKRAFYFLQILFELEKEKYNVNPKVIVFDDIADSFDYTNKYAIIEYLSELSSYSSMNMMVLTHNFDFYRSFGLKVATRKNCYFAIKNTSNIIIKEGEYLKNLFQYFKSKIGRDTVIDLAVICFSRNLIEYYIDDYENDSKYMFYTKLLHYRPHSKSILLNTLYSHYKSQFSISFPQPGRNISVYNIIMNQADSISLDSSISTKIEEKIVLALAMRIRCEKYMYVRVRKVDNTIKYRIQDLQMGELFEEYKIHYSQRRDVISLMKKISIVTPYHIHVNSFMIEPMIDVSIDNLRSLYLRTKRLLGKF